MSLKSKMHQERYLPIQIWQYENFFAEMTLESERLHDYLGDLVLSRQRLIVNNSNIMRVNLSIKIGTEFVLLDFYDVGDLPIDPFLFENELSKNNWSTIGYLSNKITKKINHPIFIYKDRILLKDLCEQLKGCCSPKEWPVSFRRMPLRGIGQITAEAPLLTFQKLGIAISC